MQKYSIAFFITLLSLLLIPLSTNAVNCSWSEFNEACIIADNEFQDWESMSRKDISLFLQNKDSFLAKYRAKDHEGISRPASTIIQRAAKEYKINPKYILTTLQKEKSLITAKKPTENQLNWAAGYACPDGTSCNPKYRGFGNQVDASAAVMRWYYDNVEDKSWIKKAGQKYSIDGDSIRIATQATANLYTYTPHKHGNKNFWKIWRSWFQNTYADGTIVKTQGSPEIWLIQNGKRKKFKNLAAFTTRYRLDQVITIEEVELERYQRGEAIDLPNYAIVKLKGTNRFFLLDYETLREFETTNPSKVFGYHPSEIIEVQTINGYTLAREKIASSVASPLGTLLQVTDKNQIYYVQGTTARIIHQTVAKVNYPFLTKEKITREDFEEKRYNIETSPIKFKDGTVFRVEGTSRIYVVEHGKRRHIPQEIFTNLGYKESVIITVDKQSSRIHKDGTSIRIYTQTNPKVETPSENTPTNITPEEPTDEKDEDDPLLITPAHETTYIGTSINNDIQAYAIVDYDTGEILAGKNVDVQRPIASLTKIMTAYRLAKEGIKQDATITYNRRKHQSAYSYYRIAEGEQVKVHDLFDAMLVSSLNIPPRMLVSHIEPDEQKFINRMNDQANTWRLPNTNFTEPAGIDPNNVSTAREYAQLFKAATKTRIVKTFAAKKSYTYTEVKDIDDRPDHQDVHTNDLVNKDGLTFTIIASKTGYLHKAGACLTMIIERKSDKKRFTIVTLGNPDKTDRFNEPERIANIAVNQF